jgi:hypothetical protein
MVRCILCVLCVLCVADLFSAIGGPCWRYITACTSYMHLIYHVNSSSHDSPAEQFKQVLLSHFSKTDDGPVHSYVGVNIFSNGHHMHLSQEHLCLTYLNPLTCLTAIQFQPPWLRESFCSKKDCPLVCNPPLPQCRQYQECVGTLQYLATWTYVQGHDIPFARALDYGK